MIRDTLILLIPLAVFILYALAAPRLLFRPPQRPREPRVSVAAFPSAVLPRHGIGPVSDRSWGTFLAAHAGELGDPGKGRTA